MSPASGEARLPSTDLPHVRCECCGHSFAVSPDGDPGKSPCYADSDDDASDASVCEEAPASDAGASQVGSMQFDINSLPGDLVVFDSAVSRSCFPRCTFSSTGNEGAPSGGTASRLPAGAGPRVDVAACDGSGGPLHDVACSQDVNAFSRVDASLRYGSGDRPMRACHAPQGLCPRSPLGSSVSLLRDEDFDDHGHAPSSVDSWIERGVVGNSSCDSRLATPDLVFGHSYREGCFDSDPTVLTTNYQIRSKIPEKCNAGDADVATFVPRVEPWAPSCPALSEIPSVEGGAKNRR